MTFLELARRVAQESGTISGEASPAAVTGQTGRLAKIVNWTRSAWEDIQRTREDWLFMVEDGTLATSASVDAYDMIAGQAAWRARREDGVASGITIYRTADGASQETDLRWLDWDRFRRAYDFGAQPDAAPIHVSIDPRGRLRLGPTPDGAYTVRFEYTAVPQTLTLGTDVPRMPAQFHMLIVWTALIYLGTDDEATTQLPLWERRRQALFDDLCRAQTPRTKIGGALA